ncbi:MAG: sugar phosphate isomerase/epimerase [Methanobacterium sp.]|jgi:sugar phosphate isomerase/epimerase|uniref:Sugar phosphate isomerase n=1 Tax=Methanobacterium subterraneum TaxID=59277 RepID=A0A2H4VQA4_9EURY|nr:MULTISPECIES: sugar phosphate isomerase/epimerase [Methanobacterium]AUB57100.1 sugar phosphate isomerase [Methanobacterium sp. MZ-A1]AUB60242.1 sugar phosphate isomerase [Methanobacterium subterraneum]MBW4257980.1 sugar phosphate isomerase/epimerase [Methanobacterium sp. YSL]MCC7560367.1 sugar phosphate isomerase/epimerase [Methanobacterium sp.]
MKIGVSTLALYPQPLDRVLEFLEERNVHYCEIINEYPYHEIDDDLLDSHKVKLTVHSPLSDINLASHNQAIRNSSIEEVKKSMDRAVAWNSDLVVVHPGCMPIMGKKIEEKILQYNLESLLECATYAYDIGVYMCVENMPEIEGLLYQDLNELNCLLEEINVFMTLDVGHAHNSGFSSEEMFDYPLIKHVHLSDNDGTFDQHNALGTGSIDFDSLFKNIEEASYDGILMVEVKNPQDILQSLDYIEKMIKL